MGQRFGGRGPGQALFIPVQERPPGCSQPDPFDSAGGSAAEALSDGGVFAVQGEQLFGIEQPSPGEELSADDESLLVGQSDDLPRFKGRQGGVKPAETDQSDNRQIGAGPPGCRDLTLGAALDATPASGEASLERRRRPLVAQDGQLGIETAHLLFQQLAVAFGGEGNNAVTAPQVFDNLEGLPSDGAC